MGQLAVRLDSMREELHQAGGHIKNAGLALTGKEPQESKELSADKGVLAKLRSFVLSCGKVFSEMERDMGAHGGANQWRALIGENRTAGVEIGPGRAAPPSGQQGTGTISTGG